jgi:hypothetical protein
LVLESSEGRGEGGQLLGITAVRVVVLKEIGLVAEMLPRLSFAFPVLVSVPVTLLFEVRLEAQVKSRWRERGHSRERKSLR